MGQGLAVLHDEVACVAEGEGLQQNGYNKHKWCDARPDVWEEKHVDQREAQNQADQQKLCEDGPLDYWFNNRAVSAGNIMVSCPICSYTLFLP